MPNASISTTVLKWLGLAVISTKGTKWALADQIVVSGSNFLSSILLARILGIDDFGRYTLAWTIVLFLQSLQYSSISTIVLSIGPKHDVDQAPTFFGAMFVHQAIFALISSVLVVVGGYIVAIIFPRWQLHVFALPIAAAVICSQTQDFLRRYFYSVGRVEVSFTIDTIRYIGQIILIMTMIKWLPANSIVGLWLVAGAAAVASFAAMPFVPTLKYSLTETLAAGLRGWHFSKWLVASTLLTAAGNNLFNFAVAILLGPAMVGAMKASQNVVGFAHIVVEAATNVIPPRASRELVNGGRGALVAYLKAVTVRGTVVMVCIVGVFVVGSKFWLRLFFGPQFESYWSLVPWSGGIEILIFLALVVGTWFRAIESTRIIFYAYFFSMLVALAVFYPLIHYFDVTGAMAGLFIISLTQLGIMLVGTRRGNAR